MKLVINMPQVRDEFDVESELERITALIKDGFTSGEVHGGWWSLDGEYPGLPLTLNGYQVRHDYLGYYVCSDEEAEHEDEGNISVGFDGRDHWETEQLAAEALAEMAAED